MSRVGIKRGVRDAFSSLNFDSYWLRLPPIGAHGEEYKFLRWRRSSVMKISNY